MTEKRLRASVVFNAVAYELYGINFISDSEWDTRALKVDITIDTDRPDLDEWFREHYTPYTSQWVHSFPDIHRMRELVQQVSSLVD